MKSFELRVTEAGKGFSKLHSRMWAYIKTETPYNPQTQVPSFHCELLAVIT